MPIGPFSRRAPLRVQPFFGFRNATRLLLNARALRSRNPGFAKRGLWRDLGTMARQYLSHEVAGLTVELEYQRSDGEIVRQQVTTCAEGYAHFDLLLEMPSSAPERTRWERAKLRWRDEADMQAETPAHILVPGAGSALGVISDIDDTILETGITGSVRMIARNWRRVMTQMPGDRVMPAHAAAFFAAAGGVQEPLAPSVGEPSPKASLRPVFYVSSSPWNLFSYLVNYKRSRQLPLGPVMLRDWGLNQKTLGSEGHGSHKRDAIEQIFSTYPQLGFVLIGDDTQKDLEAFAAVTAAHPGRVAAVFIRKVSLERESSAQSQAKSLIEHAGVPFWSGSDYREATRFLRSVGLDIDSEAERAETGEKECE